ncbi:MAG: hypothetical protein ACODAB_05855, partial [Gemmatimonadota bacterium]
MSPQARPRFAARPATRHLAGMIPDRAAPGQDILAMFRRLDGRPGGSWVFARIMARMVPYTGTIKPTVEELR